MCVCLNPCVGEPGFGLCRDKVLRQLQPPIPPPLLLRQQSLYLEVRVLDPLKGPLCRGVKQWQLNPLQDDFRAIGLRKGRGRCSVIVVWGTFWYEKLHWQDHGSFWYFSVVAGCFEFLICHFWQNSCCLSYIKSKSTHKYGRIGKYLLVERLGGSWNVVGVDLLIHLTE